MDCEELEPPPVVKLLAQAEDFQRELSAGIVNHRVELARRHGLTRARVTQLMNLLKLHPLVLAFVRSLPPGTPPRLITERKLRSLTRIPREHQIDAAFELLSGFADWATTRLNATSALAGS